MSKRDVLPVTRIYAFHLYESRYTLSYLRSSKEKHGTDGELPYGI